jgi:hypothetical protein
MKIDLITLDCASLGSDVAAVDLIARIRLAACRCGVEVRLENPSPSLAELIGFCGLSGALGVEVERQAEEREEPRGVRKKVNSAIRPSESSSTWSAHGSWPPFGLGLYWP